MLQEHALVLLIGLFPVLSLTAGRVPNTDGSCLALRLRRVLASPLDSTMRRYITPAQASLGTDRPSCLKHEGTEPKGDSLEPCGVGLTPQPRLCSSSSACGARGNAALLCCLARPVGLGQCGSWSCLDPNRSVSLPPHWHQPCV